LPQRSGIIVGAVCRSVLDVQGRFISIYNQNMGI
jgi:hypothetical protein